MENTEDEVEETEDGGSTTEAEREAQQALSQQQQVWSSGRQTLVRQRQREFADVEWLRRQLARWTNRCAICEAMDEATSGHSVQRCWRPESRLVKEFIDRVQKKIKYEDYSCCFPCGLPQEICNRWESNGQGRWKQVAGQVCQYKGVVMGGLFGLVYRGDKAVGRRWVERLAAQGVDGNTTDSIIKYLGQKQWLEHVESNQLIEEFCWATRLVSE